MLIEKEKKENNFISNTNGANATNNVEKLHSELRNVLPLLNISRKHSLIIYTVLHHSGKNSIYNNYWYW